MVLPLLVTAPAMPVVAEIDQTAETTAHASQGTPNHTVRAGETIYDIAARYHVSPAALLSRNHLSAQAFIQPGQKLRVPGRTASTSPSQTTSKPARSGSTRSYVVRSGDTLTGIAARHRMSVERLRSLNDLSDRFIRPGEKLRVSGTTAKPAKRATSSSRATTSRYTVRDGETLTGIAARHHMSLARLAKLNGISSKEFIHAGTTLKVTGSTTSTSPATHAKKKTTATKKKNNTFAGRTYSDAIVDAAHRNRSTLAGRAVPSRAETKAKITRISRQHGLDPSIALAISYQESGWDQRQVSVANAVGAMQVIPSTGEWTSQLAGRQLDLLDTDDNITAGVLLLKVLTEQADSTSEAIAGYYQGLASVESNGMYGDTKQYVKNVKALRRRM